MWDGVPVEVRLDAWVGGRYVDLIDVLQMFGDNSWIWRLEEFEGMLKPASRRPPELDKGRLKGDALLLSWPELLSLAEGVDQMIWGRLVALGREGQEPMLVVDCVDSSQWELAATDGDPAATAAVARVARLWPTVD